MIGNESLRQRSFACACLGRDRDNPPQAFARSRESIAQPPQLFIALEQVDSRTPIRPVVCLLCTGKAAGCTLSRRLDSFRARRPVPVFSRRISSPCVRCQTDGGGARPHTLRSYRR